MSAVRLLEILAPRSPMRRSLVLISFLVAACGPAPREGAHGWSSAAPVPSASDRSAAPDVIELDLVAAPHVWTFAPGRSIDGYAYNDSIPGPTIEAHVGDTLVVHFRNELSEPTTIHWHGVRVPHDMDGAPHAQEPVPPGGAFEYRFTLPDEGTFWYHPHANEPEQMERGLYGAIVVRGDDEPVVDAESVVLLDDLLLDASGALAPFGGLLETHGGREGDVQLVNGALTPSIAVRAGERQRWRFVNAGSARIYRLALEGHTFTVLGSDGGPWSVPASATELVLAPGDRLDVLVDVSLSPTASAPLVAEIYERGHGQGVFAPFDVLTLSATSDTPLEALPPVTRTRVLEPLHVEGVTPREITFDESLEGGVITFFVNGETYPDVTPVAATVNEVQVWDLVNLSEMSHPFHLHGFFFQVLSRDGVAVASPTWEDTLELHGEERVRIAFRPDDRPGMWMFHCHILEHAHGGMMGMLELTR
ncbi:MAG: multicopper oxidase family protein [Sandaracinus sp.]